MMFIPKSEAAFTRETIFQDSEITDDLFKRTDAFFGKHTARGDEEANQLIQDLDKALADLVAYRAFMKHVLDLVEKSRISRGPEPQKVLPTINIDFWAAFQQIEASLALTLAEINGEEVR